MQTTRPPLPSSLRPPTLTDVELVNINEAKMEGRNPITPSKSAGGGADGLSCSSLRSDPGEHVEPHMAFEYAREARKLMRKSGSNYARAPVTSPVYSDSLPPIVGEGVRKDSLRRGVISTQGGAGTAPAAEAAPIDKIDLLEHQRMNISSSNVVARQREEEARRKPNLCKVMVRRILASKINIFLICMPFAVAAKFLHWGPGPVFFLNFLTLIPLAAMLGEFTEEVADHVGETLGGLLNASFGNAVEMVIGVQALLHNEIRVVQASMLGSVLSNLLLVMGCCFLFGGYYNKEQKFNAVAAVANLSLLFLATIALVVPTPVGESYKLSEETKLYVSRCAALFLLAMYLQLLAFQMITHRHLFENEDKPASPLNAPNAAVHEQADGTVERGESLAPTIEAIDDDDDDELELGFLPSIFGLIFVTLIVALFSEFLVSSIDGMTQAYSVSKVFVGVILIPIVGNATEHMTAVTMAVKNRMELAMGIAVGSATQVALFVIPFLVLAGWAMDRPMSLTFPPVEIILFIMSVITAMPVLITGSSNWLHGSLLITCYAFIGFALWHEEGTVDESEGGRRLVFGVEL